MKHGFTRVAHSTGLIFSRYLKMDESTQGIIIFTAIIVVSSLLWHSILKKFFAAVIGSVVTAVVAFQIANYIHIGYLDPFFIIAIGVSGVIATFVSVAIGTMYYVARKKTNQKRDKIIQN